MIKEILLGSVKLYRTIISPLIVSVFGHGCRYKETCSEYLERKIKEEGIFEGLSLGTKRLMTCHSY